MKLFLLWRFLIAAFLSAIAFLLLFSSLVVHCDAKNTSRLEMRFEEHKTTPATTTRKLLGFIGPPAEEAAAVVGCSRENVAIYQGATAPLPNGIPTYTVEVLNVCVGGCAVAELHVACGWFSSDRLINPKVFRRLSYNDCLVNDGARIGPGQSLTFQYANTYMFRLSVSSLVCIALKNF